MTILMAILPIASVPAAPNTPPLVTHLFAAQRPNSQLVDITYSVEDDDNDPLTIEIYLIDRNGLPVFPCVTAIGHVGPGIMPGQNRSIIWNAGADVSDAHSTDFSLRLTANDGKTPAGFALVAPGTFNMGSPNEEPGRFADEGLHAVTLTRGIYVSKFEVSEMWWNEVMGGPVTNSNQPKSFVSWDDAVRFCNALSVRAGLVPAYEVVGTNGAVGWNRNANGYRLPTEAEWEYACRAGTSQAFNNGTSCLSSNVEANFDGAIYQVDCDAGVFRNARTVIGQFAPNSWGLYDMHGNVWEWCWDRYGIYPLGAVEDPEGPTIGPYRTTRGGGFDNAATACRSAQRNFNTPNDIGIKLGFRPVRWAD